MKASPSYRGRERTSDLLNDLRAELCEAEMALDREFAALLAIATDRWLALGGCTICGGTGRVVTWSTMDGPGWTEFGACPGGFFSPEPCDCPAPTNPGPGDLDLCWRTSEPRATAKHPVRVETGSGCTGARAGLDPRMEGRNSHTGEWYGTSKLDHMRRLIGAIEVDAVLRHLYDRVNEIESQIRGEKDRLQPTRGKILRVVAGKKLALGSEGECVWSGSSRFGDRVGIKLAGAVQFTAIENVEVV